MLMVGALGVGFCSAQTPSARSKRPSQTTPVVVLRSVKVISDSGGPAIEILSNSGMALNPTIESLESPPRLVIDFSNARLQVPKKMPAVDSAQIRRLRVNQRQDSPPASRVVVDLVRPMGYSTDGNGERLLVHLHPLAEARQKTPEAPSVSAFTKGTEPVAVPVSTGASGTAVEVGSRLGGDSSVTAGPDTTVLRLARGGEVRVCPGTALSVTTSQNGRDLMLGMSTGALEARYTLNSSDDSVLTPDFRMVLEGPGELHFAISADTRGNTCVRALPGNSASVMISELMGSGTYQVKPDEQVVFRSGRLNQTDATVPDNCGCPPPQIPEMRASAEPVPTVSEKDLPATVHLAQPGDKPSPATPPANSGSEPAAHAGPNDGANAATQSQATLTAAPPDTAPLPEPRSGTANVQIDAPFVFRASDLPPSAPNLSAESVPMSRSNSQAPLLTMAEPPPEKQRKGVLGKVKGFFSGLFR